MTFLEIQNQALRACGHPTTASSEPRTRVKSEINSWHRRLLTRPGFQRLLRDSTNTFTTVSGQSTYGLGLSLGRLNGITSVEDDTVLVLQGVGWLRRAGASDGTPAVYVPHGWFPVQRNPANPSPIFVASEVGADTTQIVDWAVINSNLSRITGSTTLNGTTAVQLGTSPSVVEIVKLTMRTPAAGAVTFREDSGAGATLLTLPAGQTFGRFLHVELWPTPGGALSYRVDYTREIPDLAEDTDQPLLPPDYHHLLALGAEYDEWRKLSDDRMVVAKQDLEAEIKSLNAWLWDLPDQSQGGRIARSRLGGWYPADTWR